MSEEKVEQPICHYHNGPFQEECPLGGKCERLEDWGKPKVGELPPLDVTEEERSRIANTRPMAARNTLLALERLACRERQLLAEQQVSAGLRKDVIAYKEGSIHMIKKIDDMEDQPKPMTHLVRAMSTSMPQRIQRRRTKGWKMPEGTVYVGRPSLFGNPFTVEDWGREGSIEVFRLYLQKHHAGRAMATFVKTHLQGKDLACWCPLVDKNGKIVPCHADVLLEIANP